MAEEFVDCHEKEIALPFWTTGMRVRCGKAHLMQLPALLMRKARAIVVLPIFKFDYSAASSVSGLLRSSANERKQANTIYPHR